MESEKVARKALQLRDIVYDILAVMKQAPKKLLENKIFKEDIAKVSEDFNEAMTSKLSKFSDNFIKIIFLQDLIREAREVLEQAIIFLAGNGIRVHVPYAFDTRN